MKEEMVTRGGETDGEETKEGEEEEIGLEEEELDGFSAWEEEDSLIESWRY